MTTDRPTGRVDEAALGADGGSVDGDGSVQRRAPFSTNPRVGARGQRTQQRILDAAALAVFGDVGYHQCSIDRIAKTAGCSRISFYQYFSSKEDVFRHLAGQIARQITASVESLGPLTADHDGWTALRSWVATYGDIHERYQPVFATFQAAVETDEAIAGGSVRAGERNVAAFRAHLVDPAVPPRHLDAVIDLLMKSRTAALGIASTLRSVAPTDYPRDRVEDAITDVLHRALFGLDPSVNIHPAKAPSPALAFGPAMQGVLEQHHDLSALTPAGRRTFDSLLQAGRTELVRRGYHGTRVDDIAAAAGLSHGAFYRYFDNKDQFVQLLAGQAMRTVSAAFASIPTAEVHDGADDASGALNVWLRRYNAAQASEASLIRVWADASFHDAGLGDDAAPVFDWGRRQMATFLRPRGFGDVDAEAVVLVGLLEAFGARQRSAAATETAAHIIETGLLGRS